MPNTKDITTNTPRMMVYSDPGGGKTTQFLTIPGRKFAYLFDPNATQSLRGADITYEEFYPCDVSLRLTSLSKKNKAPSPKARTGAEAYNAWEKDFEKKLESGFFNDFDVILFDSLTTFSDMVMDGVLAINGRGGQWPQQDDYGPQMLAIKNVFRALTGLGIPLYVTAHYKTLQDELTKKVYNQILVTGQLRQKLPLLFSEILYLEASSDGKGNVNYLAQTKPDRMFPTVRCSTKGLDYKTDITIDYDKPLEGQGLGGLFFNTL